MLFQALGVVEIWSCEKSYYVWCLMLGGRVNRVDEIAANYPVR